MRENDKQRFAFSPDSRRIRASQGHHVHLSADEATAAAVGRRHGAPAVLRVAAGAMHRDGHPFVRPANGMWLAAAVPPTYLDS